MKFPSSLGPRSNADIDGSIWRGSKLELGKIILERKIHAVIVVVSLQAGILEDSGWMNYAETSSQVYTFWKP